MTTLTNINARIADDLNRTDLSAQITLAINRAIEHYERENFWFQDSTASFSTVASQQTYTSSDGIPTNIKEIDYAKVTVSGNDYELIPMNIGELNRMLVNTSGTSTPDYYALFDENIHMYPTPNGVYTITLYYKKKYAALSAGADENDWTTDAEDLIESRAEWWLYSRVIKSESKAMLAKQQEVEALQALRIKTERLHMSGTIRRNNF